MIDYHIPVMLQECIRGLAIEPDGRYVDVTFGGGGHSREILARLKNGKLVAFDRDEDALKNAPADEKFALVNHDFIYMKNFLRYLNLLPVNGILADLGLSSHQVNVPERGFSFRFEGPLDMRMDKEMKKTAADIVNEYSPDKLQQVFSKYGEIRNSRTLAVEIVRIRSGNPFKSTAQLASVAENVMPRKEKRSKYLAQVFQALRIEVNGELEGLEKLLLQAADVLAPEGRLVVITYHSLEDRLVKNFINKGRFSGEAEKDIFGNIFKPFDAVNSNPITPSEEEIEQNPRARSAKLRIAIKTSA
jgi:16S rRNA (cytosine1402-N4)-methyltransferase